MKYGIAYSNAGPLGHPEAAAALAEAAEAYGVESIWTVEHVVVPAGYESEYPYSKTGKMPAGEDVDIADPLIWLAWIAALTTTVKLATGIVILPQRNPLITAKAVATLDVMSGGRTILGVGVGWLEEEFKAIGVPFEARGRRTDEYIEAMRAIWADDQASYTGEFVNFAPVKSFPKPPNRRVPIVIGGHTRAAAARAARLGDGFFPGRGDKTEELIIAMREEAEKLGRDPDEIEITIGMRADHASIREMEAKYGIARVILNPPAFVAEQIGPGLERLMNDLSGS